MKRLWLDSNQLTGGLFSDLGKMTELSSLSLSENLLSGSFLEELVHLKNLLQFNIDQNLFTGSIPPWLNSTLLEQLDLSNNFISGEITGLTCLPHLSQAFATQNLLSGSIPESSFSFLLENVVLSDNFLSSSIGLQFSNCSHLRNIALGGNALTRAIPDYICHLPYLVSLNLSGNELSGAFPSLFFSNGSLQSLDVSSNRLSGTLPFQLFEVPSLHDVLLNNNCFSGSLPETMCSNSALQYLVMNDLTSNCGSRIPKSLRPIFQGAVSQRLMSGSIPSCVWGMTGLSLLQLSGNGLTGSIGESKLVNGSNSLASLLLSGNRLIGTIPEWIQTSSILEQLDLSQNRLSGTLTASLVISSASSLFRVSVNRLSGDLPDALFSTSSNLTLDALNGNQFSCSSAGGVAGWGSVLSPSSLPQSDVNRDTYVCGSSFFDDYLLLAVVCLLVLTLGFVFVRFTLIETAAFDVFPRELYFSNWHCWRSLFLLSLLLLILYVSLRSPTLTQYSTHSKQYLWMATAAFLRGWVPVLIILLAVGAGEAVVTIIYMTDMNSNSSRSQVDISLSRVQCCRSILSFASVHIVNIVAVVATNSAYLFAAVNGLPLDQLFVIQLSLGCFKLVWNGLAIPWFLKILSKDKTVSVHRVFMSLFAFIGGPFVSTFFTSSNCFLYVVTSQPSFTSTIIVPQYSCFSSCVTVCTPNECKFYCPSICLFQPMSVTATSTPSWIYSYQCSSALLLNYIPVMIASMAISGFLLPCVVLSQFAFNERVVFFSLARLAPRGMLIGDTFDVMQLDRFLQVKTLVNLTAMLTFGFASPLLGVLVILDSMVWFHTRQVLVSRQIDRLKSTSASDHHFANNFADQNNKSLEMSKSHILTVLSFVGIFWSLFVFDMIGDVYGDLSGGLTILVPLLMGTLIWLFVKSQMRIRRQTIKRSLTTSPGLELCDDKFAMNPVRWLDAEDAIS